MLSCWEKVILQRVSKCASACLENALLSMLAPLSPTLGPAPSSLDSSLHSITAKKTALIVWANDVNFNSSSMYQVTLS